MNESILSNKLIISHQKMVKGMVYIVFAGLETLMDNCKLIIQNIQPNIS